MKLKLASLGIIVGFMVLILSVLSLSKHMFDGITEEQAIIYCTLLIVGLLLSVCSYVARIYFAKQISQINETEVAVKTLASTAVQEQANKDKSNNFKEK